MPGSLRPGIIWHFHEMPIRLSRMSHARRPVSKEAGRSGVDGGFEVGLYQAPAIDASFLWTKKTQLCVAVNSCS